MPFWTASRYCASRSSGRLRSASSQSSEKRSEARPPATMSGSTIQSAPDPSRATAFSNAGTSNGSPR
ncbi:hypothetical protein [Caballeronia sp. CLC5]|uniref:hypothetical protein n=1 Tax=Caballeronia sp. CLC5 TaxID=2906764 RepID=UPI001F45193B|nr:hypothetical protein [Caballeronia sp. CLC5]MCE4570153.1 hypothetical protein [Caballeronia sp. CLC5]